MASPRTVDQFFANTTRQAMDGAASLQDATTRYWDECLEAGRGYVSAWGAVQKAALRSGFEVQTAVLEASRVVTDATLEATRALADQLAKAARQQQAATMKLVASSTIFTEAGVPGKRR